MRQSLDTRHAVLIVIVCFLLATTSWARVIYVDASAKGENTGLDWANAWPCLQNALARTEPGDDIWVAEGTYKPDRWFDPNATAAAISASGDRKARFKPGTGVSLYGGFPRGGGTWEARNVQAHATILSGDLLGNDEPDWTNREDNCYAVVLIDRARDVTIDGFTVARGRADADNSFFPYNADETFGAGIRCYRVSPIIRNCTFYENKAYGGAAIYCYGWWPEPFTVENCVFVNNWAFSGGAAIDGGKISISQCTFLRNEASTGGAVQLGGSKNTIRGCWFHQNRANQGGMASGGAIHNSGIEMSISDCIFTGNYAYYYGGAVFMKSTHSISNCTFVSNSSGLRGGGLHIMEMEIDPNDIEVTNCIFWDNSARWGVQVGSRTEVVQSLVNCTIQGLPTGSPHGTNISLDPQLTPDGHLTAMSPLINRLTILTSHNNTDVDAEPRVMGQGLDLGADEFVDSDGDGLPDWWEQAYFGGVTQADAQADSDGDGLRNLDEYEQYSSHPSRDPIRVNPLAGPFFSIKQAIDVARDGDTVIVPAGVYRGPENRNLDFIGKAVLLYAPGGPNKTVIDCEGAGRGFRFHSLETASCAVIGFTITNGVADQGAAIDCERAGPQFRDCVIRGCHAKSENAGGLYCHYSFPRLVNCRFEACTGPDLYIDHGGVRIEGTISVDGDMVMNDAVLYGPGTLSMAKTTVFELQDCQIRCDVNGNGMIHVPLGKHLILEKEAVIDLGAENGANGQFVCEGLLHARDDVVILNTVIDVKETKFEDNVVLHNCVIQAEAGVPFGQFFIQDNTYISIDRISSEGDRYLDLDPSQFHGGIHVESIDVNIVDGIGQASGGLFELRGAPGYTHSGNCLSDNAFLCQVDSIPNFDPNTWTISRLELTPGAKLNLTNRFDFQVASGISSTDEVLYVKELILGPDSVLNTAFNRVYYETLHQALMPK